MPKASDEARQRYVNVIIEARTLCQGPHGLILPPEDAASEEKKSRNCSPNLNLCPPTPSRWKRSSGVNGLVT
jgi:hypothetical protein